MKCKDCDCYRKKKGHRESECKRALKTIRGASAYAYIDVNPEDECHYKEDNSK